VKVQTVRWRQGGELQKVHCLPGRVEPTDVTLRYGITSSKDPNSGGMWAWLQSAVQGKVSRKNISIVLLDNDGQTEAVRFNLNQAWISEWRGANLNALSNGVAIEEMTLVYETLERV
jgi:phage tail-like protein